MIVGIALIIYFRRKKSEVDLDQINMEEDTEKRMEMMNFGAKEEK